MHYTEWIIPAAIILYAVFEYQRREQIHREKIELLKRNIEPPPLIREVTIAKIMAMVIVALLLVVVITLFVGLTLKGNMALIPLAIMFTAVFIFLFLMLKRDIKIYRETDKKRDA